MGIFESNGGLRRVRAVSIAILSMIVLGLVAGTAWAADNTSTKPLVVVQTADATSLDPSLRRDVPTNNVYINVFDCLFVRSGKGTIDPALAVSYERKSPTVWVFSLRRGVRFHNGEPFTAGAVKFTIDRVLDPAVKSARRMGYTFIKETAVIDDHTIRITTVEPYPLTTTLLAELQILPPAYFERVGESGFAAAPVGTGPYRFVSWKRDDGLELAANESYWRGKPSVKRVVFKPMPNDVSRLAALLAGEADIVTGISPALVPRAKGFDGATVKTVTGVRSILVGFNTLADGPLKDKRVRQAINMAVDVDSIIRNVLGGFAERTATLLSKQDFGYTKVKPYGSDKAKARKLLAEAGYPEGFAIDMDVPNGRYMMDTQVAQAIAGELGKVGITVRLNVREWATYTKDVYAHKQSPMYFWGWGNAALDPDYILPPLLRTGDSVSTYSNPKLDALLNDAHFSLDERERSKLYAEAQSIIKEEAPMLFLYKQKDSYAVSKRVKWEPRADEFIWLFDAKAR